MSSNHPDRLPEPRPDEEPPYEGDPAKLVADMREAFLYHCWVVTHPNPHFDPRGSNDG